MTIDPPKSVKAFRDQGVLEIGWPDGRVQRIGFKTLRSQCPCAACVDEITGVRILDVAAIPNEIAPTKIELCGNYALKIEWNDRHATGLYTWQRLADIGTEAPR